MYFSDFLLVHRDLGIPAMVSIEREEGDRSRFEFNRPFSCIDLMFGESSDVLPGLDWAARSIVWLDYDKPLNESMLADVSTVVAQAASGSVLVVSVNAHPKDDIEGRRQTLEEQVGKVVPIDVTDETLGDWGTAVTYRRIVDDRIESTLIDRNGGVPEGNRISYDQLFNFHYRDGARMLTVGGILYDAGDAMHVASCQFPTMGPVRQGDGAFEISIPNLTHREIRHLDAQLPAADGAEVQSPGLTEEEVQGYSDIYRYIPNYVYVETS